MSAIIELLKRSVVLAAAITIAVVVAAAYQLATVGRIEQTITDVLIAIITYWIGFFTPPPIVPPPPVNVK